MKIIATSDAPAAKQAVPERGGGVLAYVGATVGGCL